MKILLIHCTYRFKGGEDTVVAEEQKLMQKHGAETRLLEFNNEKGALLNLLLLPFNPFAYRKTQQAIRSFQPDVVHIHNVHFAGSPSVLAAVKKEGIPLVMTLHNFRLLCPSAILFFKGKPFLKSIHQNFPIDAALKGVYKNSKLLTFWMSLSMQVHQWMKIWNKPDKYIVLSEHARRIFMDSKMHFSPQKLMIKPNFCSVPPILPSARGNFFLYIGRLTEEKGVRLMMEAFIKTGFELKMAGDGPLKEEVIALAAQHPNITYLDSLKKDAVFKWLSSGTALVFPSVWYEGMPLTIIEAYACGTPVIASKIGAMETMITDHYNGLHFEPGNVSDFVAKLVEWQTVSEKEKEVFYQNARDTYEQLYTPEKNWEQLSGLYNSLLDRPTISKSARAAVSP
jgi:glycosyltransferase involved in cell wall biosynthesis